MRLGGRESRNIEDRRGGGRIAVGGGIGGVLLVLIALFFGVDPSVILSGDAGAPPAQERRIEAGPSDAGRRFAAQVLAETEDVWAPIFAAEGRRYEPPRLVLYTGAVQSACGNASNQMGPFYCPNDQRVYIDLDFLAAMQRRLNAPGDFAAAYVIAHEVGHHVQNLLGILPRVSAAQRQAGQAQANALQVRVELQADCFAGLWARRANDSRRILEDGDIQEGMNAAAAVGDDRLQGRARGTVQPETFTHGTSAQRTQWFKRGFAGGTLDSCDTFAN